MEKSARVKKKIMDLSQALFSKMKELPLRKRVILGILAGAVLVAVIFLCVFLANREEVIYVKTLAEIGNLTVGITETGNVAVEEEEQTFDIDISEFSSENSDGFAWQPDGGGGGMGGMQNIVQIFSSSAESGASRELIVEEVFVSAGQEITAGTPICSFSEESLATIKNGLVDDEAAAKNTLQERETDLEVSELAASQELEQNLLYGELAQLEYNAAVKELEAKISETEEGLKEARETLAENEAELTAKQEELTIASQVLENAQFIIDNVELRSSLEGWIEAENNRYSSEATVESLEIEIENLEAAVKQNKSQVTNLELTLSNAKKQYETGKTEAQAVYDTRMLKYNSAQEIYDTAIASSELNYETANDEYEEAKEKLDEFNAVVVGNNLVAASDGVISVVSIEPGDSIYQNSSIITYNAYEDVSITITLEEADREKIEVGSVANVTVAALEDEIFAGEVTEIGDAVYDTDLATNTYEVTVTLSGNLEKVFDGMSVEVTLITKEQKKVLYVTNRSIIRDGSKSYVKIKNASGRVEKREVETGFSDGINVEIVEGLSEGDIVLVESKVSGS